MMMTIVVVSLPPPSSTYEYKEVSDSVSGLEERFISRNSYTSSSVNLIQSVGLLKYIFMGKGGVVGVFLRNDLKHQATELDKQTNK